MSAGHTEVTTGPVVGRAEGRGVQDVRDRLGDKGIVRGVVGPVSGARRFDEPQRLVPNLAQRAPAPAPREPEGDGPVTRTVPPVVPPRAGYGPTASGRSLTRLGKALVDRSPGHREVIPGARGAREARQV
ncbi:winged helix-turn-helix transcriptional regulator [Streptomyces sp. SP18CS02]|uniref:winged helix-turn-helix transcriptional regulator n=1 Tax=Streptomyces sp. SP18CS02 TaxID=3002531 RepID=UPI002E77200A|nr:winged helix-turn-helix transcriptional regulator [Streptomyces sp. SP18CS02]MEE1756755.1 winged helix-turn-helix transcriptional regulator [Streptomyces sp. SP18CS02]